LEDKLTEREIANQISSNLGNISNEDTLIVMYAMFDVIIEALKKGQKCVLTTFGSFKMAPMKEKVLSPIMSEDPLNEKPLLIPAHERVKFKLGSNLQKLSKESLRKARESFDEENENYR
jgi:nucleoid DNA-binding protein